MPRLRSLVPVLVVVAVGGGCRDAGRGAIPDVGPQDARWASYLSHHTTGLISRRDRIRVLFSADIASAQQVGRSAADHLTVTPRIDGTIVFAGVREIVVVPAADLPSGEAYKLTLDGSRLDGIPDELPAFEFALQVIPQDLELRVRSLAPDSTDSGRMVLGGSLVTADVEDADRIESVLSVSMDGAEPSVSWTHDPNGRSHHFAVSGITRSDAGGTLRLAWTGDPLGVAVDEHLDIDIPASNVFTVTDVTPIQGERQYIRVQFSDDLDIRQNLRGLVSMVPGGFTVSRDGNAVRVIPTTELVGRVTVSVDRAVRSVTGVSLDSTHQTVVTFASDRPGVRFAGKGTVLPPNDVLHVPFEAVNVHSVQVTAFEIQVGNVGQFLQANTLDGSRELRRVGRYLWRRTIPLTALEPNRWNRYDLDVTDLVTNHRGSLIRLTLSINRGNSLYTCSETESAVEPVVEAAPVDLDDYDAAQPSSWDYFESYAWNPDAWRDRNDPCKDSYYRMSDQVSAGRNFIASNIGLIAKQGPPGEMRVVTTDLRSGAALPGTVVRFMNFQDQELGRVTTDGEGSAAAVLDGVPFYAVAEKNGDRGYLKLSAGTAIATSHFDVGGVRVQSGLKGTIYGERGVWRPSDDIHLTFVLEDQHTSVPANHPVTMRLTNPNGQRMESVTHHEGVGGFYAFTLSTEEDAPTGVWTATAEVGGTQFSRPVRVETVVPNRLKVELDVGTGNMLSGRDVINGAIHGEWLHGALASNLKTDVDVRLTPRRTRFDRFTDYAFDDPAREIDSEPQQLFTGTLDTRGNATFERAMDVRGQAPGHLNAQFTTRVFEQSGAFSTNARSVPYSPYDRYVGIKLPAGDAARGMLLTDTTHIVEIVTVGADGDVRSVPQIELTLYKIEWKWWFDRSGESLAQYASAQHRSIVERGSAGTSNGTGTWEFEIKYPAWGRYLLRACDSDAGHCTGSVFYIDWPGWAGQAREGQPGGAAVLSFSADREAYTVGDVARIQLPDATQGRALVTVENGTSILEQRFVEIGDGRRQFTVEVTRQMAPNVYVNVTLVQPHANRGNDRPIRLHGIVPLRVNDPTTRLRPTITVDDVWRPETAVRVGVAEANGRAMHYTLAVVDEGLLGLTSYQTPDLHEYFYQKEALGVRTWDVFDDVVGAYGGELERLLALGGGGEAEALDQVEESRFPPVVRFLGPFELRPGATASHPIDLPSYIGAVRVMVVAGHDGAYGSEARTVVVRDPLSILATVPRTIGPDEEFTVPLALFATEEDVRDVTVRVEADDAFEIVGDAVTGVRFAGTGEQMAFVTIKAGSSPGRGRIRFAATGSGYQTGTEVNLEIRSPNPVTVASTRRRIEPGDTWTPDFVPHGIPGTNEATIELTTIPPLGLERRLQYLIRYPFGCVEQITSAVFAQVFLPDLIRLSDERRAEVEGNVRAGVDRLRAFQMASGEFMYWPGGFGVNDEFARRNSWVTNYVGHFLLEAERRGHYVPADMKSDWLNFQRLAAQTWKSAGTRESALEQAYRLYTLALGGRPEIGAMNRLREGMDLSPPARWRLAAAYQLAGQPGVARQIANETSPLPVRYERPGHQFASTLRDAGIELSSLVTLDRRSRADSVAQEISDALFSDRWHHTHGIAMALLAMSEYVGVAHPVNNFDFGLTVNGAAGPGTSDTPVFAHDLGPAAEAEAAISIANTSGRVLFASITSHGVPPSGFETASSSDLSVGVRYLDNRGVPIVVDELEQGTDLVAEVTIVNHTQHRVENVAMVHMVPAGWEVRNPRMRGEEPRASSAIEYQDFRDDRVLSYLNLDARESTSFRVSLHATYLGRYYLPGTTAEAMYDNTKQARTRGQWVRVVRARR